jgi:5-methylcytosine-specific restriction endonuclease McrA
MAGRLTTRLKREMYAEDGGTVCCLAEFGMCLLPDIPMTLVCSEETYATFEHLIPRARKGNDADENVRLSHRKCNAARGERELPGFNPPQPLPKVPYVPKNPDQVLPFTSEWLRWKGYC